jgi:hypothetical protein
LPSELRDRSTEVASVEMLHQFNYIASYLTAAAIEESLADVDGEPISPATNRAWTNPFAPAVP